jgi:DNA-directed RNA polymerase subunit H (RpoH/RPB5)
MLQPKKGKVKKNGTTIVSGNRPNMGVFKTEKTRTTSGGLFEPYEFKTTSIDTTGYSKGKPSFTVVTKKGTGDKTSIGKVTNVSKKKIPRSQVSSTLKSLQKNKKGGVIKSKRKSKRK